MIHFRGWIEGGGGENENDCCVLAEREIFLSLWAHTKQDRVFDVSIEKLNESALFKITLFGAFLKMLLSKVTYSHLKYLTTRRLWEAQKYIWWSQTINRDPKTKQAKQLLALYDENIKKRNKQPSSDPLRNMFSSVGSLPQPHISIHWLKQHIDYISCLLKFPYISMKQKARTRPQHALNTSTQLRLTDVWRQSLQKCRRSTVTD